MRKGFLPTAITAVLLWIVAAAPKVEASTFIAESMPDLVKSSSAVIEGKVLTVASRWASKGQMIVTDATVQVSDVLGGEVKSVVPVKTYGGTVKGFTVEAIGFPQFTPGDHVLLFLQQDSEKDRLRVSGYQQGLYRIVARPDGVEIAVPSIDDGVQLLSPSGARVAPPSSMLLDDLRNTIREEFKRLHSTAE